MLIYKGTNKLGVKCRGNDLVVNLNVVFSKELIELSHKMHSYISNQILVYVYDGSTSQLLFPFDFLQLNPEYLSDG